LNDNLLSQVPHKADMKIVPTNVSFTPKSGHWLRVGKKSSFLDFAQLIRCNRTACCRA
jgi:hypothetical protein